MKEKSKQMTFKKKLIVWLCVIFAFFAGAFAQYYYFDDGWNTYQQWCSETVSVRINSEWAPVRGGRFHLILNPNDVIYPQTWNVTGLRLFFVASSQTFQNRSSAASPSWKSWSNYTILEADRVNYETDYVWTNWLYANVKFTPVFRTSTYTIDFWMEYEPWSDTTETTLSKLWWTELINSQQQVSHLTGTFAVLQEPCIADTNKPTITNISIANNSTKKSHLSGLTFSLKDVWWTAWVQNVPYVWSNWVWTWNVWWTISNQYWIDISRFELKLRWNWWEKTIINTTPWFSVSSWDWKTWQNNWLNVNIRISSDWLLPEWVSGFWIEKTITGTFTFYDLAGNSGTQTIVFNKPAWPTLISGSRSPASGAVYVNLSDPIKLWIKDDWAGVNSGTIKVTLSGVNWTNYWPYVFSGTDLNLSGVQWAANQPDYYINISNHEMFPTSGTINVSVYAKDMEWNVDTISDYTFTTRPNCSEFQCCDPVLLDLGDGDPTYYTNTWLVISGWVNPTFTGDEQNITWVIDCNTENEWLSVYTWEDNFMFFTDESELTILWTWVKWVLSWNVLTLSYIIDSAEIIVDKPSSGQMLTTGDVDIRWHLTWVDDEDDWLSGYYIEIYSWDTLITWWFVDGTWITESLSDGKYEFVVYPVDLWWHTGSAATWTFSIDTVVPSVVITWNDVWMCSPAWTIYTITWVFSEAVTWIDASTLTVTGGTVKSFNMISDIEAVWTVSAGSDGTGITLVSILTWAFEDLAGNRNTTWTDELSWDYDWEGPEFTLEDVERPECTDWTMIISWVTQVWCASGHVSPYSWDAWDTWWLTSTNTAYSGWIGEKIMTVRVRDAFWNYTEKTWKYTWTNVNPSVEDISVENVWLWTWVNWMVLSNAHEWECWTWTIEFSWFIDDWSHWTCTEQWWIITYVADTDTEYEWGDSCIFEITDDEWSTATWEITFTWIDTKKPECEISYNENVCTSGDIALTMSATGATQYSWIWFTNMVIDNLPHNVNWNGIYTWYVEDAAGNTWICTGEVVTFDNDWPIIAIPLAADLTAEECTLIQWVLTVTDDGGCGNWFNYSWVWFGNRNNANYSWYSDVVTWHSVVVSVWDPAWNISNQTLNYTWTDTWVQLDNWAEQTISTVVLTWWNSYNATTGALISLFGANEWNCWPTYISVSEVSCSWLSMDIDSEWNVAFTWNSNLFDTGSCTLRFSDDDWNSADWELKIRVDTVAPWLTLQWSNEACMRTGTFDMTWIFTEPVIWFDDANNDIDVDGWYASDLVWNGTIYTWKISMTPMVITTVSVPAGVATDVNWNPNTAAEIQLTWMYDTAWPNKVTLSERVKVYSETSKFSWQPATDSGCAWVSGYIRELYEWSCEWTPKDSWITGAENFTVSWLENSGSYCRRVRSVDNFWNMWEWSDGDEFVVDLSDIWCDFDYVQACTNWTVQVTLIPGDEWYSDNWTVYLSWQETWDWHNEAGLTTWVIYSGQTLTWYIWQPATEKFNSCNFVANNIIDKANPEITSVTVESVPECTTWTATATAISDEWCGQWTYTYNWNSEWYKEGNSFQRYLNESWTQIISLMVKDNAWNQSASTWVVFVWTDSPISGNNFTWYTGVWRTARTVNWREMSEVSDWDCGSGTITFSWFVDTWTKWICTRVWDEITYTPNPNEVWDDSCTIQVKDDEWWTKDIVISWEGIDTKWPRCTVSTEPLLSVCVSGSVAITLHSDEEISSAEWWDINRWIFGTNATWNVFANWSGNVVMSDLVWNTWVCEVAVNNINTGVLDAPVWLSPANGSNTNDNTLTLSWSGVSANWCRGVSWYEVQIIPSWWETITWFTNVNSWTSPELPDGEYTIKVKTIDGLWGESEWTEITITIDTEKPTCEIQYDNACISGNVQLAMVTTWADFYSWTNFSDMSESLVPNDVSSNWTYDCFVKDLAWNTWTNSTLIINIKTWVLSDPSNLAIVWWTPTNDNTPEFTWSKPDNDGCREVSGYVVQILSWWDLIDTISVDGTWWNPSSPLPDWEYTIIIKTEDTLSWESEWIGITFVVDTSAPNCSIEVMTANCTNSGVEIKLSGDTSDILTYSWWNWTTWNFWNNITTIVNQNGEYTWYVYDEAWNEWTCVWVVWTWIQDQILISYTTNDVVWFECEVITWSIVWNIWDSCWKDDLSKFTYSRPWWINTSEYGTSSNNVLSWFGIQVTIVDWAGNSNTDTVKYTWNDTWVTLSNWASQSIDDVLTWTFEKAVAEIVDLFWATEWACWTWNITVTWTICSWASISVENWIISINPDSDLDWVDWYCEFEFWDNEWEKTITWKVVFIVDTKQPWITLTWTNLVCMNTDTFDVTWIFTEPMMWFESWDVIVSGWTQSNFVWDGISYTWKVYMDPMVETKVYVSAWVATDLNWNENTESNMLTGMYDNAWPNDVSFVNWQDEIYLKNPTIFRSAVSDQGCAWLSGYNWVLSSWNSCNDVVDDWFTTDSFVNLDNLSHEATYTLCVQTVDNFWNTGNRTTSGFYVDLNAVWCMFEETECSNEWITLTLIPSNPDWTWIYLSWTWAWYREDEPFLTQYVSEPWKMIIWYVYQTWDNPKQSSCIYTVQKIDKSEPTITSFADVSVPECTTWDLNIIATDEGCGNTWLYYSWDGSGFALNNITYSLWSWKAWSKTVELEVKDNVWNTVSWSAIIEWTDSPISGNDITVVNVWMWSWINWRELSEVSDWLCGSGTVEFSGFVNTWSHGICTTWDWDTIVYVPVDWYTGSDTCIVEVKDDDEQTIEIEIIWEWVDTEKPSCTLTVQEWQNSCISWTVNLILNSNSSDLSWYSFDRETFWNISATGVSLIWIYTWYVIDVAWNISDPCTVEVTWWILDLDEPTLEVSDWIWYECDTWTITITWTDNSCGISWLYYRWEWFENTTNTNEIYSWIIWSQTVNVSVFDWVWHVTWKQVTYTWQNAPVTWSGFTVGNAGTWITVDWYLNWHVSAWSCELDDILAESSNTWMCEISGHNIIYKPTEWLEWEESCTITITDWDEEWSGDIEIEITFTWVDTQKPTVTLVWWVWEQCTSENTFIVTWEFSEEVVWVITGTLQWENVNIVEFTGNWDTYSWTVEMLWWTWRVWLLTWWITDVIWNELMTWDEKILWNYDNSLPSAVSLIRPTNSNSRLSYSNTISFEWSGSTDEWCAWISWYILEICSDELCTDVIRSSSTSWTGKSEWSLWGSTWTWTGYWRVISEDMYWNTWVSIIQSFGVDARNPNCSIVEQEACTQWDVQLILTWDREISIIDNWWVNWDWTWMYYTWQVSENEYILVIVEDIEGRTWQCELPVSKHDLQWPEIVLQTWEVNECEWTTIQIVANYTGCAWIDGYTFWVPFWSNIFQTWNELLVTAEQIWNTWWITKWQVITVVDAVWNDTTSTWYELDIVDVLVSLSGSNYSRWIITWNVEGLNIINIFWANEWSCGTGDLTVEMWNCTHATWILIDKVLVISPDDDIEQAWECEIYIKDNEWNIATWYISYQVDTQAPVCEISYSTTWWTNWNVVATINCEWEEWTGWFVTNNSWENEYTFEETWEFVFEFIDKNGNTWSITWMVDWIDKTDPECTWVTYSVTWWTSWDVLVTFDTWSCTENVTLLTGNWITGEDYVFTWNWEITFIYEDDAWNTGELVVTVWPGEIVWIDKLAPSCEVLVPDGWTNTWVILTMNVEWDVTWYSWNNVDWLWTDTGLFVENIWTYTWYVRDEVWNIGICTWEVTQIDKERPTIVLEWTNVSWCTNDDTFVVTWTFSESEISEFAQDKIHIENWIISDFVEVMSWQQYTWTVTMTWWRLVLYVATGEVHDKAWNENDVSNVLISNYDNAWPGKVIVTRPDSSSWMNYWSTLVLQWNEVEDQWCIWVSWYVYKVCEDPDCNTVISWWITEWTWVDIEDLWTWTYYWIVYPEDNYGNTWNETTWQVIVDLTMISCRFEETECSNTWIILSMFVDWSGTRLSWTWFNDSDMVVVWEWSGLTKEVTETWTVMCYVYDDATWRTWSNEYTIKRIDKESPTITTVIEATWYECETITWSVEMTDEWCGSGIITYIWDWLNWTNNSEYGLFNESWNNSRIVYVTGTDGVWNTVTTWVKFEWLNSPITWVDFTWDSNVWNSWRSANWREMSQVSDWACGSWTIVDVRVVYSGSKWECMVEWDTVTYTPYMWQTGSDVCVLKVRDDEWDTGSISIAWEWIDTDKPSCMLTVQDPWICTSWTIMLNLSSESDGVAEYSFDWENRTTWAWTVTTWTDSIWIYTWYVKDNAWNVSEACGVEVTWWILDLDEPTLEVSDWIWYECDTWTITITWTDNSCGISWLYYRWEWFENTTNTNEIYSWIIWSQTVNVSVFDWVWHVTWKQVTYTWQNAPVTWSGFTVGNAGTWITVDWYLNWHVSAWSCELDDILAESSNTWMCEISGHNIIYKPTEWLEWEESCTITITDWDEEWSGDIEIEITFTWVDTQKPTVTLVWWVWEQCTNRNTFTVTWRFTEVVAWIVKASLKWENVNVESFRNVGNSWITYEWTLKLTWWTWKVRIETGDAYDTKWNLSEWSNVLMLWNYDNKKPQSVSLITPESEKQFDRRSVYFEWSESVDDGCAWLSWYIIDICKNSSCNNVTETVFTDNTWVNITLQDNGNYYRRVTSVDNYWNRNTWTVRHFSVQSNQPRCSIIQSACSTSPVNVTLTWDKEISIESGNVAWQQVSQDTYSVELTERIDAWAIVKDSDNQTWYCHLRVTNYDNVWPDFELGTIEVNEWTPLNINIVANDTWCAQVSWYRFWTEFGPWEWQTSSGLSITAEQIWNIWWTERDQVVSVMDTLWNITTKTWKIIIKDVKPIITQTWAIDWIQTWEVIVDVIDLLWAEEWDLWTWDLEVEINECVYATGYISGQYLIVNVAKWAEWIWYCTVKIKDNEWSYADVDWVIKFEVDTKEPVCTWFVFNPAWWTSWDSVSVSLTGCSEPIYSGDTTFVFTWNGDHTFEVEDDMWNTWEIVVHFTWFDREVPNFDFDNNSGYECQTWILTVSNAVDAGIWLSDSPYSFDGTTRNTLNTKQVYSILAGEISVSWYVRDWLGNYKVAQAGYIFNDSEPTATWFSIYALSGAEVNWKELSNASDWACGSGTLTASVSGWTAWTCSISGDTLIYEPKSISSVLIDTCDLTIYDDEWNKVNVSVWIKWISDYPDVELVTPINGLVLDPGNVKFAWRWQWNSDVIDRYVYNIWSSNDDYTVEQTWLEVSIDLKPWAYQWNVYAKYIDATTWWLSDTYSFNVVGENSWLAKDKCPNWDFSDSFYDWRCDPSGSHSAADICGAASSSYSDELKWAYVYAYSYWITTMCPIQSAYLDWYLIRSHFAKMISEFAVNVLGKIPESWKAWCDKFNDIDWLSDELRSFVITSCELNLMWQESDWVTPAKSFNPDDYVTRAQFGTVLSRLLFGDIYNIKDESKVYMNEWFWYKNHLEALKNYWIMTKIDGDWPNSLERRWRVMLMLERADEYWVFAGKIPAKNWVKALFDE